MRKIIFNEEQIEKMIYMNDHHYSYSAIAKEMNCCVDIIRTFFRNNNIIKTKSLKNHDLNENYFETIDTEEKAYLLGLLITDGSIRKGKNNQQDGLRLQLKIEDEYMIKRLKAELNSSNVIQYDKRPGKACAGIEIHNQKICDDLAKFQVVPNKTYILNDIKIDLIPQDLQRHYLRGLIDGDGSIGIEEPYNQPWLSFCGYNREFIMSFQKAIDDHLKIENHNKISKSNAFHCKWKGSKKVPEILKWLYEDATIYLERKKRFYDLYKDR